MKPTDEQRDQIIAIAHAIAKGNWHRLRDPESRAVDGIRDCHFCGELESKWDPKTPCPVRQGVDRPDTDDEEDDQWPAQQL